jgi:phosphoribosylformylglycinamidine synthase
MLGILEDASKAVCMAPEDGPGILALVYYDLPEDPHEFLGASEYLAEIHNIEDGIPAAPDMNLERDLCNLLVEGVQNGWIRSAHDVSEGGFAVAAAEVAMACPTAVSVNLRTGDLSTDEPGPFAFSSRVDALLFGETPGRVLVALPPHAKEESTFKLLAASAETMGLRVAEIGSYGKPGGDFQISLDGAVVIKLKVEEMRAAFDGALASHVAH